MQCCGGYVKRVQHVISTGSRVAQGSRVLGFAGDTKGGPASSYSPEAGTPLSGLRMPQAALAPVENVCLDAFISSPFFLY